MKNITAASLFLEYRSLTEKEAETFNSLKGSFPEASFPKNAARVWRYGVLAEIWGSVATALGGGKVNYLQNWRTGK